MCIACEMGFWMAMEEPRPAPAAAKRKRRATARAMACETADDTLAKQPKPPRKRASRARQPRVSAGRE